MTSRRPDESIGFWIRRLRVATAVLGVAFHLALLCVMSIFMLNIVICFLYLAVLLPIEIRAGRGVNDLRPA